MRRRLFNLLALFPIIVAAGWIAIGIWAMAFPSGHGISMGWHPTPSQSDHYELTARWQGADLRGVYCVDMMMGGGHYIFVPPRSISLWPIFIISLAMPLFWLIQSKRRGRRGFEVVPVRRSG